MKFAQAYRSRARNQQAVLVIIGPVIPFGTSSFHMAFAGTISLSSRTLTRLLHEVCMSLYQGGFPATFLFSSMDTMATCHR